MRLAGVWPRDVCCAIKWALLVHFDAARGFPPLLQTPQTTHLATMTNIFGNVPVFGKLLGKVFGTGVEVKEKKKEDGSESPSFPDYMLDPDAVVSLVISQICSSSRASTDFSSCIVQGQSEVAAWRSPGLSCDEADVCERYGQSISLSPPIILR